MFRWIPFAMVRVTAFFATGIIIACHYPDVIASGFILTVLVVLAGVFLVWVLSGIQRTWSGVPGLLAMLVAGYAHVQLQTDRHRPDHIARETLPIESYRVRLVRYAEEKENSWKSEAEVLDVRVGTKWKKCSGRILIYFPKKHFRSPFAYGDVLLVHGSPSPVKPPANPGEFDLRRLLQFRNIYHIHYLHTSRAVWIAHDAGSRILSSAIAVRLWADRQIRRFVRGDREQATASALVLGVTDGLDNDLLQAYASTGAMHVLAVSGLHVSIMYWIILLIGKPLEKLRHGKAMLAVVSVALLWMYAFVTGWSPSVLRAVMMFSFIALARPWKQSTNIYNTMAASAFCLLVYDPFFVMSVGFQLSYVAVFGIVFFHPFLYRLWEPRSRVWDEIWKVTSVSIAAQLATFPISLYYFHQFPNYFLVANLLVIPASTLVLVAGIALLPLSVVPPLASAVGHLLHWSIRIMNGIVEWIGGWPFSLVQGIYIDALQAVLLSGIVVSVALCFLQKRIRWLWYAAGLALLFSVADWHHYRSVVDRHHITVYSIGKHTAIDLVWRGSVTSYSDSSVAHDDRLLAFHVLPARIGLGGESSIRPPVVRSRSGCDYIYWMGKTIVVVKSRNFVLPKGLSADLVVIANRSVYKLRSVTNRVTCRWIVVDSSNSLYFAESLLRQRLPGDPEVYSVPHLGAFQLSF